MNLTVKLDRIAATGGQWSPCFNTDQGDDLASMKSRHGGDETIKQEPLSTMILVVKDGVYNLLTPVYIHSADGPFSLANDADAGSGLFAYRVKNHDSSAPVSCTFRLTENNTQLCTHHADLEKYATLHVARSGAADSSTTSILQIASRTLSMPAVVKRTHMIRIEHFSPSTPVEAPEEHFSFQLDLLFKRPVLFVKAAFPMTRLVYLSVFFSRIQKCPESVHLRAVRKSQSTQISASHQHLFHQHSAADTQVQPSISESDGWAGGAGGRDDEPQSGGSAGTVINGLLPETSAPRLSIIRQPEEPSQPMTVSAARSLAGGGHATTPFEVFITAFCHYMIKVIVGRTLTRTVFPGCNKSAISSDDKRRRRRRAVIDFCGEALSTRRTYG
ncbi:hypothetical protein NQZ68_034282 [Xyrichtys novacula]|uniref:Uncharacterized protein n=1 Tax=Xyrichtys novacula TaxID=13765 RepID=A0AAV1GIG8_XYRNO|nr:hypothetical protein NQZ68_034282 [Xyrichtys novacula]